ncbi:MAG: hypothetical protein IPP15_00390 [Saprospiraceae bacterium]|uniref:Uncharacterized protein n=1 Tax=Candidatus Opimibacter skivensis TaxID=2982028 RepID=A0A9D7XRM6_9BACT|nr:hypothetical protein [Candidatus Opimibacter skivensis]
MVWNLGGQSKEKPLLKLTENRLEEDKDIAPPELYFHHYLLSLKILG